MSQENNINLGVVYNSSDAKRLGVYPAIVLQTLYRINANKGWQPCDYAMMTRMTALSRKQLASSYKKLIKEGLIEKKVAHFEGIPNVWLRLVIVTESL